MDTPLENPSRRGFLKVSASAAGGLLLAFHLPARRAWAEAAGADGQPFVPNAHLRIDPDDTVTVVLGRAEMGQSVYTSIPMLVAEELEADWQTIRVEFAPVGEPYKNPLLGVQGTGGSTSVKGSWEKLRRAGATARMMLVEAAADTWGVPPKECRAREGAVVHAPSGRSLRYGALAGTAATLPPPAEPVLKSPGELRLIGKPLERLDGPAKVTGRAGFGIDVAFDGLLTAVIARPPVLGGRVRGFEDAGARKVKGVRDVVQVESGVAVLADGYWPALQGRRALDVDWDLGPNAGLSSQELWERMERLAESPGITAREEGDAEAALAGAERSLGAVYRMPFLAHACMEPLNATAWIHDGTCEIWTGTQFQGPDSRAAAEVAGVPPERVLIHSQFLGGGFGRRANPQSDFVVDAVRVAKASGRPVKLLWTREDDTTGGWYRPCAYNVLRAGLDAEGRPVAWTHRVVTQSIFRGTAFESFVIKDNGLDPSTVEGAAELPYAVGSIRVDWQPLELGIPVQWWRAVGHSLHGYVTESFLDELAHAAGRDPYAYRVALLGDNDRIRRVLDAAAERSGWGGPLAEGRGRGIAVHESFGSVVAHVAEASVDDRGRPVVHRVVTAIDCGLAVNPNHVRAQMESSVAMALSALLGEEITFADGRVQQSNFDSYPLLRMEQMPVVETHIVDTGATEPTGVGEPALPPLAAAVTNALFAATGTRIRSLPIGDRDLRNA